MAFNSLNYLLFLPAVFLLHYFSRDSFRWIVLLTASFIFYAALKAPHLILVLFAVTAITYGAGIVIGRSQNKQIRAYILTIGITANIFILVVLKYLPFLTENLNKIINVVIPGAALPVSSTIIAVGTSYFILQAVSYLSDVYRNKIKPEYHPGYFALYMSFFPKLLQGPIERGSDLLPQLKQAYVFNYDNVRSGMVLFAWGLLKKIVIADRLALMVNSVYDNVYAFNGLPLLIAVYYYALQIYFDFSGYTDMALGTAKMFNINLTPNFKSPYFSTSIGDFWKRWHITFSYWLRDYLYIPMGGSRGKRLRTVRNLMITMFVSGLWHGANWGFIVWGLLHGFYISCSVLLKPIRNIINNTLRLNTASPLLNVLKIAFIFNLVSAAWIFFRLNDLGKSFYVLTNIFPSVLYQLQYLSVADVLHGQLNLSLSCGALNFCALLIYPVLMFFFRDIINLKILTVNSCRRWLFYILLTVSIALTGFTDSQEFIYFRF